MASKRKSVSESVVSAGAAPAREKRKHSPVKRDNAAPAETSPVLTQYPDPAETARLAYSYWEARSCQGGSAEEDWLRAEQELRNRTVAAAKA